MRQVFYAMAMCTLSAITIAGCGPTPTTVSGTVSFDGQPLAEAMLEFVPVAGDGPTSAVSAGPDGMFRATVPATRLKVVIHASRATGQMRIPGASDGVVAETRAEILPPRYSDRRLSELSVTPLLGKNTVADFALASEVK